MMSFISMRTHRVKTALAVLAPLVLTMAGACADPYHGGYDDQRERAREYRANAFCRPATGGEILENLAARHDSIEVRTLEICSR